MGNPIEAKVYRHVDCGGILIPHIFSEIKTSSPALYTHGCTGCNFRSGTTARAHEAWTVPAFATLVGASA